MQFFDKKFENSLKSTPLPLPPHKTLTSPNFFALLIASFAAPIFVALESNGLKLQSFAEFDYSPYHIKGTVERQKGQYVLKNRAKQSLPYLFTLKATKK